MIYLMFVKTYITKQKQDTGANKEEHPFQVRPHSLTSHCSPCAK